MSLSQEEKHRYSRHLLLDEVGEKGQLKLKEAKVLVIGAGGLGCPVLQYLSAVGIGTIGIIDFDIVDVSNLQRQILFNTSDIGKNKAIVARDKLLSNNPFVTIEAIQDRLTNQNALELFSKYDIIVDGTDNFETRYMVNDACVLTKKPLVYGAIYKFEGQVSVFNFNDGPTYRCLFPEPPKAGSVPSCSEVGVIGVLPGVIGVLQANEVIKIILEKKNVLVGRLLLFNAMQTSFTEVKIIKNTSLSSFGIDSKENFEAFDYAFYCKLGGNESVGITKLELDKLPKAVFILDVRESWEQPKVEGKKVINAPLDDLDDYVNEIPKEEVVYVICQKGGRSAAAIEFLEKEYNYTNLINVEGGMIG